MEAKKESKLPRPVTIDELQVCILPDLNYSRTCMLENPLLFPEASYMLKQMDTAALIGDNLAYFYLRMDIGFRHAVKYN